MSIVFIVSNVLSYIKSPKQIKKERVFYLSDLGDWQEGSSFFTLGSVFIAYLLNILASEVLRQKSKQTGNYIHEDIQHEGRADEGGDVEDRGEGRKVEGTRGGHVEDSDGSWSCCCCKCGAWAYWIGFKAICLGLIITGCFQESYNPPWHMLGAFLILMGFVLMFVDDLGWWCKVASRGRFDGTFYAGMIQILLFVLILVSGTFWFVTKMMADKEWSDASKKTQHGMSWQIY